MIESRKQKLVDLGPEKLAEALLNLARHSPETQDLIDQLVATPEENFQRVKKKLASLKRSRRFIDWRNVAGFVRELEMLLQDLECAVDDPLIGLELVASFYETDKSVFERCDDSSGDIGDVFRHSAKERFLNYAANCSDKEKVAQIVLKIYQKDDYGVRFAVLEGVGAFLPEEVIRDMITIFQKQAEAEEDAYKKGHYFSAIESLARQIKDPGLFELTRIARWGNPSTSGIIDIAEVYLESDDVSTAQAWLMKIPEHETYLSYDRNRLLKEIYSRQGDSDRLAELQYQELRTDPSMDRLEALLDTVGHEKRESVLGDEVSNIMNSDEFRTLKAEFLITTGKIDEAERYILQNAFQLNGYQYEHLLSLAASMESENRYLVSSLIYRSLLVSILDRGYQKAYTYGARYLKKLDKLSTQVSDWKDVQQHESFKAEIRRTHGLKRSFWAKYDI